jgi:hypothetical protein
MRFLRHWKTILGLSALFAAGFFCGAIGLLIVAIKHPSPESLSRWVNYRFKEYENRLKLTQEQKTKIKPMVQKARDQVRTVVRNGVEQTVPILDQAHTQISAELTAKQREEFDKIHREMIDRLREFEKKEAGGAKPAEVSASP